MAFFGVGLDGSSSASPGLSLSDSGIEDVEDLEFEGAFAFLGALEGDLDRLRLHILSNNGR